MTPAHIACLCAALAVLACPRADAQEKFHLKSDQTGRLYGPFELASSNRIAIGASSFTIVLKEEEKKPTAAKPTAQPQPAAARNPEAERAAVVAAAPWLMIIDEEQYDQSWDGIADYLKRSVEKEKFLSQLKTVRNIFGRLKARTAKRTQFLTSMPSAPDGSYVVIQYETEFAEKKAAVETVVMVLDKDDKWRVSGYDVR